MAPMDPVRTLLVAAFWIGLLVPVVVYVLYPAAILALARVTRPAPLDQTAPWPSVTVAIAAHNEERDIGRAIRSVLLQEYPGRLDVLVGLDGCTDGTAAAIEALSEPRAAYLDLPRAGKAATDNALVAAATGDVVITTAAGAEFAPGTVHRLAEPFRDPRVGCTTGRFAPRQDGTMASGGEGMYWRMEYAVMAGESRLGILGAASGTCMAHRRSIFRPIPTDSDGDVAIAPNAALQGARVLFVRDAVVHDDGPARMEAVLRNRRRMALRAMPATLGFVRRLLARRPGTAFGLIMHKVLRWLVPFFVLLWALAVVGLVLERDEVYTVLSAILLAIGIAGSLVFLLAGARTRGTLVSFAMAQVAFALAVIDMLLGRRARMWTRS